MSLLKRLSIVFTVFFLTFIYLHTFAAPTSTSGTADLAITMTGPANANNAENFEYNITITNNGPDDAHGSIFKSTLFTGVQDLVISCSNATGGSICPTSTDFQITTTEITTTLQDFPNRSSMQFSITGKFPLVPATSVNHEATITVPTGMTESNNNTNTALVNTQVTKLDTDLAVTSFSQNIEGVISTTEEQDPVLPVTYSKITSPVPITYTVTYTNNGPGSADGGNVRMALSNTSYRTNFTYKDASVSCSTTGGAECPTSFGSSFTLNNSNEVKREWFNFKDSNFYTFNSSIPKWPAGSTVTMTFTITPVKMELWGYNSCGTHSELAGGMRVHSISTSTPSSINEIDSSNNGYRASIAVGSVGDVILDGNIGQNPCPSTDLAVTSFSQNIEGVISTTEEQDPVLPVTYSKITSPVPITYTVTYTNNGPGSADGGNVRMALSNTSYRTNFTYKDASVSCSTTGGAECPTSFGSSFTLNNSNEVTRYWLNYNGNQFYTFNSSIPKWPAGSTVTMTFTITPVKMELWGYNSCGTHSELAGGMRVHSISTSTPSSINEIDSSNNGYRASIAVGSVGDVILDGNIGQNPCPSTDLAVTSFSQNIEGVISTTEEQDPVLPVTYSKITSPVPITYTVTYTNNGPGAADGGNVRMALSNTSYYTNFTYKDASVSCSTTGGAECPTSFGSSFTLNNSNEVTRYWLNYNGNQFYTFNSSIPKWPAGSTVTMTFTITPVKMELWGKYNSCGIHSELAGGMRVHSISTSTPSSINEIDSSNNGYRASIAVGSVGDVILDGNIGQNPCIAGVDISVKTLTNDTDLRGNIQLNKPFQYTTIYRNNGTGDVANIKIVGKKINRPRDNGNTVKKVNYKDYSIDCIPHDGAVCPVEFPNSSLVSYGGSNILEFGKFDNYYSSYVNTFYDTIIPTLPVGGWLEMKVKYTLYGEVEGALCRETEERMLWSDFTSNLTLDGRYIETNTSNNSVSLTSNNLYCSDLYVNNILNKTTVIPGESLTMNIEVGNAGRAAADGSTFSTIVPAGFTEFSLTNVTCTTLGGSSCDTDTLNYDTTTGLLTGKVRTLPNGGKTTYSFTGKAISYSSSWNSDNVATLPLGYYERIQNTNTSRLSFTVQGTDPSVSKSISKSTADLGDELLYTIRVSNPVNGESLSESRVEDILPDVFQYVSTESINLSSATRTGTNGDEPTIENQTDGTTKLSWNDFTLETGGSIIITFKVKVKEQVSCYNNPYNNSAFYYYTKQDRTKTSRFYDGNLPGLDQDDVAIQCTKVLANRDIIETTKVAVSGGATGIAPTSYNILANDIVSGKAADSSSVSIELVDKNQIPKQLLHLGSSNGVDSYGYLANKDNFVLGDTSKGFGGTEKTSSEVSHADYLSLPTGTSIDTDGIITFPNTLTQGVYLTGYKICEKTNTLNCSIGAVVITVPEKGTNSSSNIKALADSFTTTISTLATPIWEKRSIGGTASDSAHYNSDNTGNFAFEPTVTDKGYGNNNSLPAILSYTFGDSKAYSIEKYTLFRNGNQLGGWNNNNYSPSSWTFEASNDGINWTVLDTKTDQTIEINATKTSYNFNNTNTFKQYRINITKAVNGSWANISKMEMLEKIEKGISTTSFNLFYNDTLDSATVDNTNVNVQMFGTPPIVGATISENGVLTIPANTEEGVYQFTYKICEKATPTNCSAAIAEIQVQGEVISFTSTKEYTATATVTRDNCQTNFSGSEVEVSVTKTATKTASSQSEADSLALAEAKTQAEAELASTGQTTANTQGTCTQTTFEGNYTASDSKDFTKNDCQTNFSGNTVTYTATATRMATASSQSEADRLAKEAAEAEVASDIAANGQSYANTQGTCTQIVFTSTKEYTATETLTRNNCQTNFSGSDVLISVTKTATKTASSQSEADSLALAEAKTQAEAELTSTGQAIANTQGTCTQTTFEGNYTASDSKNFTKNDCQINFSGNTVTYTATVTKSTTAASQAEADRLAKEAAEAEVVSDIAANGQSYANTQGTCTQTTFEGNYTASDSKDFTKNDCQTNFSGSTVTYTVTATRMATASSQPEADRLAKEAAETKVASDIAANGQDYANKNGVCKRIPPKGGGNQEPIANDDTILTKVNTNIIINVLKNDSDPDGDTLTISRIDNQKNGRFSIQNKQIKFVPKKDFVGKARVQYSISDGSTGDDTATVVVTVTPNNPRSDGIPDLNSAPEVPKREPPKVEKPKIPEAPVIKEKESVKETKEVEKKTSEIVEPTISAVDISKLEEIFEKNQKELKKEIVFEPISPIHLEIGATEFTKYPTVLPRTGSLESEDIYAQAGLAALQFRRMIDIKLPPKETFKLVGQTNPALGYWLQVVPKEDRKKDRYIVLPSQGLVMPVNSVKKNEPVYKKFINGENQDFYDYLRDGAVEIPGTSTMGYGEIGNKVIAGHSSYWYSGKGRYKTHFQKIIGMESGEEVWVYERNTSTGEYTRYIYEVFTSYNTSKEDIDILKPVDTKQLTLFTCTPIGGSHGRWVVKARMK